jgi:hypothetical protein
LYVTVIEKSRSFCINKKDVNKNPYTVNLIKLQLCKSPWYVRRIPFPLSLSQRVCTFLQEKEARRRPNRRIKNPKLSLPGLVCVAADVTMEQVQREVEIMPYTSFPFLRRQVYLSAQCTATVQVRG